MRTSGLALAALALSACFGAPPGGADGPAVTDDLVPPDAASPSPDLRLGPIQAGALGAACASDADCTQVGKDKVCFREFLLNSPAFPRTPGGYCSAYCTIQGDCGPGGVCVDLGFPAKVCLARCDRPGICRGGYACLLGDGVCVPAGHLTCDPTANEGRCEAQIEPDPMAPKVPGGCIRQAYENLGRCAPTCEIGPGSCRVDPMLKLIQHCVYMDLTVDLQLRPTRDRWKGLVCMHDLERSVADGQPCRYFEECLDGSQCDLWPGGSNRCYPLCVQGGTPGCPAGTTCQDQLRAGPGGPGLCK